MAQTVQGVHEVIRCRLGGIVTVRPRLHDGGDLSRESPIGVNLGPDSLGGDARVAAVTVIDSLEKGVDCLEIVANLHQHTPQLLPRRLEGASLNDGESIRRALQPVIIDQEGINSLEYPRPVPGEVVGGLEPGIGAVDHLVHVDVVVSVEELRNGGISGEQFLQVCANVLVQQLQGFEEEPRVHVGVQYRMLAAVVGRIAAKGRIDGDDVALILDRGAVVDLVKRLQKRPGCVAQVDDSGKVEELLFLDPPVGYQSADEAACRCAGVFIRGMVRISLRIFTLGCNLRRSNRSEIVRKGLHDDGALHAGMVLEEELVETNEQLRVVDPIRRGEGSEKVLGKVIEDTTHWRPPLYSTFGAYSKDLRSRAAAGASVYWIQEAWPC